MKTIKNTKIQKSMLAVVMGILMIALFTPVLAGSRIKRCRKRPSSSHAGGRKTRQRCLSGTEREVEPPGPSTTYQRASSNTWILSRYCSTNMAYLILQQEKNPVNLQIKTARTIYPTCSERLSIAQRCPRGRGRSRKTGHCRS